MRKVISQGKQVQLEQSRQMQARQDKQVQVRQGSDDVVKLLIDRYGKLDEEIKRLMKLKERLREKLLTLGEGEHKGNEYTVIIVKNKIMVLDPIKVAKILGVKETLKIATISLEKARALLGAQVQKCVKDVREVVKVFVKGNE